MSETEVEGTVSSVCWESIRSTVMHIDDLELIMDETHMVIHQFREEYNSCKDQLRQLSINQKNYHSNLSAKYTSLSQRLKKLEKSKKLQKLTAPLTFGLTKSAVNKLTKAKNSIARKIDPVYLNLVHKRREAKRNVAFWTAQLQEHRTSSQIWTEKLMKDIPFLNLDQKPVKTACWEDVMALMRVTELEKKKPLFFRAARRRVCSKWVKASIEAAYTYWFGVRPRKTVRKLVGGYLSIADEGECKGAGERYEADFLITGSEMKNCYPNYAQRLRFQEEDHLDEEWPSPKRVQNVFSLAQYEWDYDDDDEVEQIFI